MKLSIWKDEPTSRFKKARTLIAKPAEQGEPYKKCL